MPTDLPLSTLGLILNLAHPDDTRNQRKAQARHEFYRTTSLVHREWTEYAQRALWKFVNLDESRVGKFVRDGGAGRYPIERLMVAYLTSRFNTPLETLFTSARGVRDLRVADSAIDGRWLCGNNWADLKSLELDETLVEPTGISDFPFALTRLVVKDSKVLPDEMVEALSRQVSITSLELFLSRDSAGVFQQLSPLVSQLVRLDLTLYQPKKFDSAGAVNPFLAGCTQLKYLTSYAPNKLSIDHLPNSLESWTLTDCRPSSMPWILDVFEWNTTAVSKIQFLVIHPRDESDLWDARSSVRNWGGWGELEELCETREIQLSVGVQFSTEELIVVPEQ